MKAVALLGDGRVELVERSLPALSAGEVLVRVSHCGLCGSDKRLIRQGAIHIPGHEIVGTVVDSGPGVDSSGIGDGSVVIYIPLFCETCGQCRRGRTNRCTAMSGLVGWQVDGGFAEYLTVPRRNVVPVPPDIPAARAVLSLDTIGTAAHGLHRLFATADEDDLPVVVLGCGPLGMGVVAVACHWGKRVLAYDVDAARAAMAASFGAEMLGLDSVAIDDLRGELNPSVVDASGSTGARSIALDLVGQGGGVLMLGEGDQDWILPASVRWRRTEATYVRSFYFPVGQMDENWELLRTVGDQLEDAIVTLWNFDDTPAIFASFLEGALAKPIIEMVPAPAHSLVS
jgi:threonine dehydrogenase-like Zn-dependent dehydrogenase